MKATIHSEIETIHNHNSIIYFCGSSPSMGRDNEESVQRAGKKSHVSTEIQIHYPFVFYALNPIGGASKSYE